MHREMKAELEFAHIALRHDDNHTAEVMLQHALGELQGLEGVGSVIAASIGTAVIKDVLDTLDSHPALDRNFVLRDARFDLGHHPYEADSLQRRWSIANEAKLSKSEIADLLEAEETRGREVERAALRLDVNGCKKAYPDAMGEIICPKVDTVVRTAARLDATRR